MMIYSHNLIIFLQDVGQLLKVQQLVTTKVDSVIFQPPSCSFKREEVADLSEQLGRGGCTIDLPQDLCRRQLMPQDLQSDSHIATSVTKSKLLSREKLEMVTAFGTDQGLSPYQSSCKRKLRMHFERDLVDFFANVD